MMSNVGINRRETDYQSNQTKQNDILRLEFWKW